MALPILDGNQTATTLSTILTGGAHIPSHTVVSLGSQAITDMRNAVSGSVVSVSNFPASQTIAGTVTANLDSNNFNGALTSYVEAVSSHNAFPVEIQYQPSVTIGSLPAISGTVTASLAPQAKGPTSEIDSAVPSDPKYMINVGGIYPELSEYRSLRLGSSGEVVVSSVTIGSLPAISGTVTVGNSTTASAVAVRLIAEDTNPGGSPAGVNVNLYSNDNALLVDALKNGNSVLGYDGLSSYVQVKPAVGSSVTIGSLPAISGTVTANVGNIPEIMGSGYSTLFELLYEGSNIPIAGTVTANLGTNSQQELENIVQESQLISGKLNSVTIGSLPPISGTVTANVGIASETDVTQFGEWIANGFNASQPTITVIGSSAGQPFPISGTVTVGAVPNGSLTTRFGTPTTAGTAFETSAVTNANRKYLLIQNVTTGGNVITVGVGFTPTTTQGIQLLAGAGITFESSYIPTGAVRILSSVTASNFTILEA